jgi:hypothetical protein
MKKDLRKVTAGMMLIMLAIILVGLIPHKVVTAASQVSFVF